MTFPHPVQRLHTLVLSAENRRGQIRLRPPDFMPFMQAPLQAFACHLQLLRHAGAAMQLQSY